jgi:tRNA (guanine37-N1)-methyltransferase
MLWKAQDSKKISVKVINPRDFSLDKHKKVDGRPYGGGPGMVLAVEPILRAIPKTLIHNSKFIILSPRGKQFTNKLASEWAKKYKSIVLIAGHYEGIDARVKKILKAEEVSVGPYTLTGGELPALTIIDAITRRLPGVLGKSESLEESRVASSEVYTRPEVLIWPPKKGKKYRVPKVLLSGHAKNIEAWKLSKVSLGDRVTK